MPAYNSLGYEIGKVHKALRAQFQALLTPHGVTVQQFEVMRTLKSDSGTTAAQLVECIISDSSTIMSIINRLELKGLIVRKPDESDRRTKRIYLTTEGRKLTENLNGIADQYNDHIQHCLTTKELHMLKLLLSKLYHYSQTDAESREKEKNICQQQR